MHLAIKSFSKNSFVCCHETGKNPCQPIDDSDIFKSNVGWDEKDRMGHLANEDGSGGVLTCWYVMKPKKSYITI